MNRLPTTRLFVATLVLTTAFCPLLCYTGSAAGQATLQTESKPRLTRQDACEAATQWLIRSEKEFTKVTKIPNDFPDDDWWSEIIRAYVDAGDHQAAGYYAARWHRKFGQSCGREMIRLMALRLSDHGHFDAARQVALILVQQNNPMLLGFSMYQNEELCVDTLIQIIAQQAISGDFAGARQAAELIPRKRYPRERSTAYYYIAIGHARHGDANGIQQLAADYAGHKAKRPHESTLLFAVELAMAGAFEDATQMADTLPATSRRIAFARIALAQAIDGKWSDAVETANRISKVGEKQLALLRLAAVKVWLGDHDGAVQLVDEHIGEDSFNLDTSDNSFSCRRALGKAHAWAGDFDHAVLLCDPDDVEKIRDRLRLGQILDYSPDEKSFRSSGHRIRPSVFDGPEKLTRIGLRVFHNATAETLPFLEMIARGENIGGSVAAFAANVQTTRPDDFDYLTSIDSLLGATCVIAGDTESAVRFLGKALEAADETDFRTGENLSFMLCSLVRYGGADDALQHLNRVIHVKHNRRRVLSNLLAQVAFALAETRATDQLEELLNLAPRQSDRALVCLGAAQGFLAAATPQNKDQVPRDAYEMLIRCGLQLPLPETRGAPR